MVIFLTFVTILLVLAAAVYDLQQTNKAITERRHSAMTTPGAGVDSRI
ncbi:hypothetical protein [Mongoliimonas terrestris]|nr:hypothetical protein [Mongoliimonas terrestris]